MHRRRRSRFFDGRKFMSLEIPTTAGPYSRLIELLQTRSAQAAADFFLSPYVSEDIFLKTTEEAGPTLWIVNRSDVYDETLKVLSRHPIAGIQERALDKLAIRSGLKLQILPEAEPFEPITRPHSQDEVEEILGHPLAPFEAMLFFVNDLVEDTRASAALSLTRRLLEHRPSWLGYENLKETLNQTFFEKLKFDTSPFAKSFLARIPLFRPEQIREAIELETHPFILGRLFQNPAFDKASLEIFLKKLHTNAHYREDFLFNEEYEFARVVLFLDQRLDPTDLRAFLLNLENATQEKNENSLTYQILKMRINLGP